MVKRETLLIGGLIGGAFLLSRSGGPVQAPEQGPQIPPGIGGGSGLDLDLSGLGGGQTQLPSFNLNIPQSPQIPDFSRFPNQIPSPNIPEFGGFPQPDFNIPEQDLGIPQPQTQPQQGTVRTITNDLAYAGDNLFGNPGRAIQGQDPGGFLSFPYQAGRVTGAAAQDIGDGLRTIGETIAQDPLINVVTNPIESASNAKQSVNERIFGPQPTEVDLGVTTPGTGTAPPTSVGASIPSTTREELEAQQRKIFAGV